MSDTTRNSTADRVEGDHEEGVSASLNSSFDRTLMSARLRLALEERDGSRAPRRDFLMSSEIAKKCAAELIGTFWLTLGSCGTAVIAASFPQIGVGLLGVSFAFGLTVLTMAYAIGHTLGVPSQSGGDSRPHGGWLSDRQRICVSTAG
jgi:hypothetical protein